MIILWSKYPDMYMSTAKSNTTYIMGELGFIKSCEHYAYYYSTGYIYSDEDEFGTNSNRFELTHESILNFVI